MKKRIPDTRRQTAVECASEGFPVAPRSLRMFSKDGAQTTTDPVQADYWWSSHFKKLDVCLLLGQPSGVIAVVVSKGHGKLKKNGFPALFKLQKLHGELASTSFFEDAENWTLLYACPSNSRINGIVEIAEGITVRGDGEWLTLPPYFCAATGEEIQWPSTYRLTRANLKTAPRWLMSRANLAQLRRVIEEWQQEDAKYDEFPLAA